MNQKPRCPDKLMRIILAVLDSTGCEYQDLAMRSRTKPQVRMRSMYAALARELTGASLVTIGRAADRSHTTVLEWLRRHEAMMSRGGEYADMYAATRRKVVEPTGQAHG